MLQSIQRRAKLLKSRMALQLYATEATDTDGVAKVALPSGDYTSCSNEC